MFLVVYKIVCIVMFAFFSSANYSWVLVSVLIFGSLCNYVMCNLERPYYNEVITLFWNMTNGVYLWVNSVLFICMLLKDTSFSGGVQLIGIGLPISIAIEYFRPHPKCYIISRNLESCKNGEECENYLRFLTQIIQFRHEKDNRLSHPPNLRLEILLEAYVNKHIGSCHNSTCTLNTYHRFTRSSKRSGNFNGGLCIPSLRNR
ncbi:MAG: hypothetical protein P4M11_00075 [Candidatus Pacebacteria bacterium]|nr:hypothetical protein [Candidatus Paceibacterota bacterium]